MVKVIDCIHIEPNGTLSLCKINMNTDDTLPNTLFDCKYCKKFNVLGTSTCGPYFRNGNYEYILYYIDIHRNVKCDGPINKYSNTLLSWTNNTDYIGDMYLLKSNTTLDDDNIVNSKRSDIQYVQYRLDVRSGIIVNKKKGNTLVRIYNFVTFVKKFIN